MKPGRPALRFPSAAGHAGIAGLALAAAGALFVALGVLILAPGVTFAEDAATPNAPRSATADQPPSPVEPTAGGTAAGLPAVESSSPPAAANLLPATLDSAAGAAFRSVPDLDAGYRFLYEQKFPEARGRFAAWSAQHPGDPFGHISVAASCLFEEFYRQGIMTSDYFLDDKRFLRGIDGEPDEARMRDFHDAIAQAVGAATRLLNKDPRDADALFALTLAEGMHSNAASLLEKKQFEALRQIKQADRYAERLLSVRPDASDAWLALGSANYIIGSLSGTARFFLWFGGIHGDRVLGMRQLEKTATGGRYLQPYAKILLALAARREGQEGLARRLLLELTREFPGSPLFAAEYARVAERPVPAASQ